MPAADWLETARLAPQMPLQELDRSCPEIRACWISLVQSVSGVLDQMGFHGDAKRPELRDERLGLRYGDDVVLFAVVGEDSRIATGSIRDRGCFF